jgi:hypothetical protein
MAIVNTNNAVNSSISKVLSDQFPRHEPFVRYAFVDESGIPKQEPILHSIYASIPEEATFTSGIYLLTKPQLNRLNKHLEAPYANPSSQNIATTIQNECEDRGKVLYPIHAESDEGENEIPFETMIGWLEGFIQESFDTDPDTCKLYFSGNRSIHIHVPLFMAHDYLTNLKNRANQYCEETEAILDTTIYKSKQQFRLPGADYFDLPPLQKAKIESNWTHEEIIYASASPVEKPETYVEVLKSIFPKQVLTGSKIPALSTVFRNEGTSETTPVESDWGKRLYDENHRSARLAKEFYPHRTGDDFDGRSTASLRVKAEPFEKYAGGRTRTFVPCYFYGAHSCSGRKFTKFQKYAPLQLSKADVKKWDYEEEQTLVIIGGGNYESIILEVDEATAKEVGDLLNPDNGSRAEAQQYLEAQGYDIGKSGPSQPPDSQNDQSTIEGQSGNETESRASKLQKRAEQGSVEHSLTHHERRDVANRLLTIGGWDSAWQWFERQYGTDFSPQRTWDAFNSILNTHSNDFADIEPPSKP